MEAESVKGQLIYPSVKAHSLGELQAKQSSHYCTNVEIALTFSGMQTEEKMQQKSKEAHVPNIELTGRIVHGLFIRIESWD